MAVALEHAEFSKHLNTEFRIHLNETETLAAELTNVSEHLVSPAQERFAITFQASGEAFLGQGLRQFEHDQMGSFDLFIVPIGRNDKGFFYEAVFNRLVKT
jgi:hypothetical protein